MDRRPRKPFPLCPRWPRCRCIVRGYINPKEPNDCGRKPKQPPRPIIVVRREGWR